MRESQRGAERAKAPDARDAGAGSEQGGVAVGALRETTAFEAI